MKYGVVTSSADPGYGYVGPKTRAKLAEVFGEIGEKTPATKEESGKTVDVLENQVEDLLEQVRQLQAQLEGLM
jgi:hypothetical protein